MLATWTAGDAAVVFPRRGHSAQAGPLPRRKATPPVHLDRLLLRRYRRLRRPFRRRLFRHRLARSRPRRPRRPRH
jgi:hypothetical protein